MRQRAQTGSFLAIVLFGLAAVGVLASIAYGSYYQIARGTQDTANRAKASAMLTQAAYTLATEAADTDADGVIEPMAGSVVLGDAWEIPSSSGAAKVDAWGTAIKYCPRDNGSLNASSGRLTGANPALQTSVQFAVVSAGPDKTFDTSCVQAFSGVNGDDGVRTMTVAQLNQGVGGTVFYGDPVSSASALPATGAATGMMRIARDTQIPYLWTGSAWLPLNAGAWLVVVAASSCATYPAGTLGRDAVDDLYLCTSLPTRIWKKVQ